MPSDLKKSSSKFKTFLSMEELDEKNILSHSKPILKGEGFALFVDPMTIKTILEAAGFVPAPGA